MGTNHEYLKKLDTMAIGIIYILGFSSNLRMQQVLAADERLLLGLIKRFVCDLTFPLFIRNGLAHSPSVLALRNLRQWKCQDRM